MNNLGNALLHYTTMIAAAVALAAGWFLDQPADKQMAIIQAIKSFDLAYLAVPICSLLVFLGAKLAPQKWADRMIPPQPAAPAQQQEPNQ